MDLCCGQGRHALQLAKIYSNLNIFGLDQSSFLISLAQERACQAGLSNKTNFTVGDCRNIPFPENYFDLIIVMGNSFGYFADENGDKTVLDEIFRVLKPLGRLVLDLTDGGYMQSNFAQRSWEWVDDGTFVSRERQLSKDGLRLISREIVTCTNKGVIRDQFYQERLYTRDELEQIIKACGLEVVRPDHSVGPEPIITLGKDLSKRNEDLGMMEQRMLFIAMKPQTDIQTPLSETNTSEDTDLTLSENSCCLPSVDLVDSMDSHSSTTLSLPSPTFPFKDIVILLGDTSLPCIGKLYNTWNKEDFATRQKLMNAIEELGYPKESITVLDKHDSIHRILAAKNPSYVFNLCDEGFTNDALKELHIPAILEMLDISYSGAGPNCLAYCYDKGLVNRTADALGIPTPREAIFLGDVATPAISDLDKLHEQIETSIHYPAFIKPIKGDNSLGITTRSIIWGKEDLESYMKDLREIGIRDVLIQEYLRGSEYGIGMIGNSSSGFHFFPILEVDYAQIIEKSLPPILGFESKWDPQSPYWTDIKFKRAELSPQVVSKLKQYCITLWERFGCRDYARFDFRCDVGRGDGYDGLNGTIKLLEVNPNPGWCWDGKLAYMSQMEGIGYSAMLKMIISAAWERLQLEQEERKK